MQSDWIKGIARAVLPLSSRRWISLQGRRLTQWPPVGLVRFGSFRRLQPISRAFGSDRGLAICHYYIRRFLAANASDIRGHVLEIGDNTYTREFGSGHVARSDVLHVEEGNPKATIVADLTCTGHIPSDTFDCIICTQTLQHIYDVSAALKTLHRILRPGGVLLATFPGISQISRYDMDRWGDYWRFTTASSHKLFTEFWPSECVTIEAYGNVAVAIAYLHGLASGELRTEELDFCDPDYQVLITVRAIKSLKAGGAVK